MRLVGSGKHLGSILAPLGQRGLVNARGPELRTEYDVVMRGRGMDRKAIDRFAIATGSALIEIATEKIGLDIIGKRLGPSLRKSIGDAWLRGKPKAIANALLRK